MKELDLSSMISLGCKVLDILGKEYKVFLKKDKLSYLLNFDLKKLFKYGVHEFYTYPDEAKSQNTENETSEDDTNVVQMVKK